MKKISNIFLLAISATLSLHAGNNKAKFDPAASKASLKNADALNLNESFNSAPSVSITPWVNVVVTNGADLTTAIQAAAVNPTESTIIYIDGTMIGNFVIPATINQIRLVGTGASPIISADGSGTALTVLLGATVSVELLTVTAASGQTSFGIVNNGSLRILKTFVKDNAGRGGVHNSGTLFINQSSISNNSYYGIESLAGGVTEVKNSSINENGSTGIYIGTGVISLEDSTIDGNRDSGFYAYYGSNIVINRCQIRGNIAYGVFNVYNSSTSIFNTTIESNTIGGIANQGCICLIKDSTVSNHPSQGIYNHAQSLLNVKNCAIDGNGGSGIVNAEAASLFVDNSTFRNNSSPNSGGAIYNDSSSVASVSNCIFASNTATSGGGIYNEYLFTLTSSKVRKNVAAENGGGIYNDSSGSFVTRNVALKDNVTTSGDGGGMYNLGIATIVDCRIKYNNASRGGGFANTTSTFAGLFTISPEATLSITNSIVKHNVATSGSGGGGGIYNTATLNTENSDISENIPDQIAP